MDQDELSKSKTTSDEISLEASKRGFELTLVRLAVASRSIVAANRLPFGCICYSEVQYGTESRQSGHAVGYIWHKTTVITDPILTTKPIILIDSDKLCD